MTHRVLPGEAGDPAGTSYPTGQLGRRIALNVERTPDRFADRAGTSRVQPDDRVPDRVLHRRPRRRFPTTARCIRPRRPPPGLAPLCTSARREAATTAFHQSPADCSAPPSSVSSVATGSKACETTRPLSDSSAALGPPVPRSTASTKVLSRSSGRTSRVRSGTAAAPRRPWAVMARNRTRTRPGRCPVRAAYGVVSQRAGRGQSAWLASTSSSITTLLPTTTLPSRSE